MNDCLYDALEAIGAFNGFINRSAFEAKINESRVSGTQIYLDTFVNACTSIGRRITIITVVVDGNGNARTYHQIAGETGKLYTKGYLLLSCGKNGYGHYYPMDNFELIRDLDYMVALIRSSLIREFALPVKNNVDPEIEKYDREFALLLSKGDIPDKPYVSTKSTKPAADEYKLAIQASLKDSKRYVQKSADLDDYELAIKASLMNLDESSELEKALQESYEYSRVGNNRVGSSRVGSSNAVSSNAVSSRVGNSNAVSSRVGSSNAVRSSNAVGSSNAASSRTINSNVGNDNANGLTDEEYAFMLQCQEL